MIRTSSLLVLFACAAMSTLVVVLSGCEKRSEAEKIPSNSPTAYMKDSDYMAKVDAMDREQKAIMTALQPLLKRRKELSSDGTSVAAENVAEWKDLSKKVKALNVRAEAVRQQQLALLREKMTPAKEISK